MFSVTKTLKLVTIWEFKRSNLIFSPCLTESFALIWPFMLTCESLVASPRNHSCPVTGSVLDVSKVADSSGAALHVQRV